MRCTVSGCTPYLLKYIADRKQRELSNFEATQYVKALEELEQFMLVDGLEFAPSKKIVVTFHSHCLESKFAKSS